MLHGENVVLSEWVELGERRPDSGREVLLYIRVDGGYAYRIASYDGYEATADGVRRCFTDAWGLVREEDVLYWMELPRVPNRYTEKFFKK